MVTADFPKGIALWPGCLHDRKRAGERKADRDVTIGRQRGVKRYAWKWTRKRKGDVRRERERKWSTISITEWAGLLPRGCRIQSHKYVWLLFWKQLRFPFSKIFFPYLSDPSGEIHLLALTPASSSKSGTRLAQLTRTHAHTHTPAAQKQTLTTDRYRRPCCCLHRSMSIEWHGPIRQ